MKPRLIDEPMLAALDQAGFDTEPLRPYLDQPVQRASVLYGRPRYWVTTSQGLIMITLNEKPAPPRLVAGPLKAVVFNSTDITEHLVTAPETPQPYRTLRAF